MLDKMRDNAQSWGIKIIFVIIILAFIFAFAGPNGSEVSVLAYVNGEPISVSQFQRELSQREDSSQASRGQILAELISTELLRQLAVQNGIIITDGEVRNYIQSMPAFQTDSQFDLQKYKSMVSDPESFEQKVRHGFLENKMGRFFSLLASPIELEARPIFMWQNEQTTVNYALISVADYIQSARVEEEEMQSYYDNNIESFALPEKNTFETLVLSPKSLARNMHISEEEILDFYEQFSANLLAPEYFTYKEIFIPFGQQSTQHDMDELSAQAGKILEDIASGISFELLASENPRPNDPRPGQSKTVSGQEITPTLFTALANLEVGAISEPLATDEGIVIVRLEDRKEASPLSLEDAREDIIQRLTQEKAEEKLDDYVEKVIAVLSQGKSMAEAATSIDIPLGQTGAVSKEELATDFGLTPETAEELSALEQNEPTLVPVRLKDGYLLVTRLTREEARTQTLEEVRPSISSTLLMTNASEQAKAKALAIIAGEAKAPSLKESQYFSRSGPAPVAGVNTIMIEDAFATAPGEWLASAYPVREGYLIAKAGTRTAPSDAQWLLQEKGWLQTAQEINRQELNIAFQQYLIGTAEEKGLIEIVRKDLIQ